MVRCYPFAVESLTGCILDFANFERRSQEYKITVKDPEYWLMNDSPTEDETGRRYLSPVRLVKWIFDKGHGDSSDVVMKLCSTDPWKHTGQKKSEEWLECWALKGLATDETKPRWGYRVTQLRCYTLGCREANALRGSQWRSSRGEASA